MNNRVKVAVVDTGVNRNHEYLKENIIDGVEFKEDNDYILITDNFEDENGHGTHCASVIKKEYEDVDLYIVKILNKDGNTNIQILEEALKHLQNIDANIINLSLSVMKSELVKDLEVICETLKKQGKVIICSVANEFETSFPASFKSVIGVRGFILENENALWYNKTYGIQCIVDNNSYLSCDLNNNYKLFGKCNSYAAAKLTGKVAKIISRFGYINETLLDKELIKLSTKKIWSEKDLEVSKRYPESIEILNNTNQIILDKVSQIINKVNCTNKTIEELCNYSLFNIVGEENYFEIIKCVEKELNLKFDYLKISRYDLISIYTLLDLINRNIQRRDII